MQKPDKGALERFAFVLFIGFSFLGLILLLKRRIFFYIPWLIGIPAILAGIISPLLLHPVYKVWMSLATKIGTFNTKVILFIVYYLVFVPIGFMLRVFGLDLLDQRIEKEKDSYWKRVEERPFRPQDYERQF